MFCEENRSPFSGQSNETSSVVPDKLSNYKRLVKGKGFPLQAWNGSWGSRRLRLLDLLDFRHYEGGKVVTLTHRPSLPPGVSWYSFLEAESTQGTWFRR
jgi:hypothetical protein